MDLEKIQNPEFLKTLTTSQLIELAADIRAFLIQQISKTGGHLASNLGVVELTIALHYVFNSPEDKIFFDVGHQCYTHKILTGRAGGFSRLRQYGGISGFEKRCESEHDVWEAGHSSTSLSAALGMAVARDLDHKDYEVIPVIGDGALSSGMSFEALNQIGSEKRHMIIIFNDNNMSISKNVGAMTYGFSRLRAGKGYNDFKTNMKTNLRKSEIGKVMYSGMKNFKDAVKTSMIDTGIFGEFNLEYMGPVDGHNIRDLIRVLKVAHQHDGPVVVHVITQKGKGYAPCEMDRKGVWHGVGPFNAETGKPLKETPAGYRSYSKLVADTVSELAAKDQNIVALTPAMINGSALNDFFAKYPDRSFDCGIAEEHAATFAASLANSGKHPFLAIYSSFLQRAYDQINHDICRMDLPVVIGIDRAGLVGEDGPTHHGVFDIGFLRPIPNLILCEGRNAQEIRDLLHEGFAQKHPFAIRFPRGEVNCRGLKEAGRAPIGTWELLHDSVENRLIVLSYGPDVDKILNKVEVNNLPVTVVNCRYLKPFDEEMLSELLKRNLPMICYETDQLEGGLGSGILEYSCDHNMPVSLKRFGIKDHYASYGNVGLLRSEEGIDLNSLYKTIEEMLEK